MTARIVRISATLLLVLGLVAVAPQPASAQMVCATKGVFELGAPMMEVFLGGPISTSFTFRPSSLPGVCHVTASGTISGWCSMNNGAGTTSTGHSFTFVGTGPEIIITGGAVGVMTFFAPDQFWQAWNSCLVPFGAWSFDAAGVLVLI